LAETCFKQISYLYLYMRNTLGCDQWCFCLY